MTTWWAFLRFTPFVQTSQSLFFSTSSVPIDLLITKVTSLSLGIKVMLLTMTYQPHTENPASSVVSLPIPLFFSRQSALPYLSFQHNIHVPSQGLYIHWHCTCNTFPQIFHWPASIPSSSLNWDIASLAGPSLVTVYSSPRTPVSLCYVASFQSILSTLHNPSQWFSAKGNSGTWGEVWKCVWTALIDV